MFRPSLAAVLVVLMSWVAANPATAQDSVFLEELTWPEVRDAIRAGKTTVVIPTGGTEQNGPHMVLGKHNIIVRHTAGEIAKQLGNALVAPVLAYVPEGNISPPSGMMTFAGTISLPDEYFIKVLEFAARSLKVHGFLDIAIIGDSGGNQKGAQVVADTLNREWASTPVRVHAVTAYYSANGFPEWLQQQGESLEAIGSHATITDTSQVMVLYPAGIRSDKLVRGRPGDGTGITGDPTRASIAYGQKGLELKIAAGVRAIRELRQTSR
jgi:creatinine amidohydrolase/Fe(II)-dependent formamide hydrolase-like protein